ncbi:carbamoyl phosphate synthase small subunit [Massilibacterium senegalense]|uniref:carbamoyl phosphate synthase small subunit n=1 Tax=Massilibacterium senegalense TaxID=1632858 RepID=UPI00078647D4|nr:carbamoyl phosphate synthase small subunit [Massilibacterium senegalense]
MKRQLILEDGSFFVGEAFGSSTEVTGEVIFSTGMTGYQETITNPGALGTIVTFTYPLIGNYGINRDDFEAIKPWVQGVVVKEVCTHPSNFRSEKTLDEYLKEYDIPGIANIDTRKLTRLIRDKGTLKGRICSADVSVEEVVEELKATNLPTDQVKQVSTKDPYVSPGRGHRVVMVDYGMKHGLLRELIKRQCDIVVVPYDTTAEEILRLSPDGILLSNGPGNPKDIQDSIEAVKALLGKVPVFGIGLGHQVLALAAGADTEKMKHGHNGGNAVKVVATGKVDITSQAHGYVVTTNSVTKTDLEVTHVSLNDETIEGLRHTKYPAFSVQFHPEASPGAEDANGVFDQFITLIENTKKEGM